nr:hypothetical protein [uncultured Chryseobacterium sp.]
MKKKNILILINAVLIINILVSTDCHSTDGNEPFYITNPFKISLENKIYHVNDIIWVDARVSSNVYDQHIKDSLPAPFDLNLSIGFSKLVSNQNHNLIYASNRFEFQSPQNDFFQETNCPNHTYIVKQVKDNVKGILRYRIGIIPKETGNFVLNFDNRSIFENTDKKQYIINQYPVNSAQKMVWEKCISNEYRSDVMPGDIFIEVQ